MPIDKNRVWEIIDSTIIEVQKDNEAIHSEGGVGDVVISYAAINNHILSHGKITTNMWLLCNVSESTLRLIIKDIIDHFRVVP